MCRRVSGCAICGSGRGGCGQERFDLALVPDRSPVLGLLVALAGIPRRAGLDSGGRGFLYTDRVPIGPDDHSRA